MKIFKPNPCYMKGKDYLEEYFEKFFEENESVPFYIREAVSKIGNEDEFYQERLQRLYVDYENAIKGRFSVEEVIENHKEVLIEFSNKKINLAKDLFHKIDFVLADFDKKVKNEGILVESEVNEIFSIKRKKIFKKKKPCFCQKNNTAELILCLNQKCKIKWFHCSCVGLKDSLVFPWTCSDCKNYKEINSLTE